MHWRDNIFFHYVKQRQKNESKSCFQTKMLQRMWNLTFFYNIDHAEQET